MTFFQDPARRIFALAGLTLLLELACIRWFASNVFHLGFFSNLILLACFLGIGVGFLISNRDWQIFKASPLILFLTMALTTIARVELPVPTSGSLVFIALEDVEPSIIPIPIFIFLLFLGIVGTFVGIAQETGRSFKELPPIKAYTADILGSLTGILFFTVMSFFSIPSAVWFLIGAIIWGLLLQNAGKFLRLHILLFIGMIALSTNPDTLIHMDEVRWSPYQMVTRQADDKLADHHYVNVNRIPHQVISKAETAEPWRTDPYRIAEQYGKTDIKDVLIIGSGSGVDVSTALREGATHVDAVEIDPIIADYAKRLNADQPYSSDKVNLINDDGRHFLETTDKKYDLIILALPDSLTLLTSQSNIRLESFLFTQESFKAARDHLKPDGVFSMYNFYRSRDVIVRIAMTLESQFGHLPHINPYSENFAVLAIGPNIKGKEFPIPDPKIIEELPSDDWPFLYLTHKHIPILYIIPLLIMILLSAFTIVFLAPKEEATGTTYRLPFFLMGAAFLLLETKSIIQFSLLFGSTWVVNSLVFAGVLVMVLLANMLVDRRKPKHLWVWYLLLFITLAIGYIFQVQDLVGIESGIARYLAAVVVLFSPIFCANVIFAGTFVDSEASEISFGWNLFGTMFGGGLEYLSLATGYRSLAALVAVLYIGALVAFIIKRKAASSKVASGDGGSSGPGGDESE